MAEPAIWGPSMWRLLHTLAERLGKQTSLMLIQDEQRAWIHFIRSVENVIPCKRCKAHFGAWIRKNRPESAVTKDAARSWLWGIHDEVNKERAVVGGPTLQDMEGLYASRNSYEITSDSEECIRHLLEAVQRAIIATEPFRVFKYRLSLLRKFTG